MPQQRRQQQQKPTGTQSRLESYVVFNFDGALYIPSDSIKLFWSGTHHDNNFSGLLASFYAPNPAFYNLTNPSPLHNIGTFLINQFNADSLHQYSWNSGAYELDNFLSCTYNTNGLVEEQIEKIMVGGAWENQNKYIYTYDAAQRVATEEVQNWSGVTWEKSAKEVYNYDANGNILLDLILYWNTVTNVFDSTEKYDYTYDPQQNVTSSLYRGWVGGTLTNSTRITYTNTSGRRVSSVKEYWIAGAWTPDSKIDYSYDVNGNRLNDIAWTRVGTAWQEDTKDIYDYNASGKVTSNIHQVWNGTTWDYDYKSEYAYSGSNLTDVLTYTWGGTTFDKELKYIYTYNTYNQILVIFNQEWNGTEWETTNTNNKINFHYETYEDNVGIADILPADVFTIFPNPTQNYIQITMKDKAADAICITDISGKVVYEIRSTGRPNELKIPVGQLADGVYCLQVISGSQKGAKTFVVRH